MDHKEKAKNRLGIYTHTHKFISSANVFEQANSDT